MRYKEEVDALEALLKRERLAVVEKSHWSAILARRAKFIDRTLPALAESIDLHHRRIASLETRLAALINQKKPRVIGEKVAKLEREIARLELAIKLKADKQNSKQEPKRYTQ